MVVYNNSIVGLLVSIDVCDPSDRGRLVGFYFICPILGYYRNILGTDVRLGNEYREKAWAYADRGIT